MEVTCSRPFYTKEDISGIIVPTYNFEITTTNMEICAILSPDEQHNLQTFLISALAEEQNSRLIPQFVNLFIESSAKYFAKKYNADQIIRLFTYVS